MVANLFIPQKLVGRQVELQKISQILSNDGDLLLAGVPGSGRRTLLRAAVQTVGARMLEIDCLRATDSHRFLQLLAESLLHTFPDASELALIQRWTTDQPIVLEHPPESRAHFIWSPSTTDPWLLFQRLLDLPQFLAETLSCRIVIVFQNFPHIRSWDRSEKWQSYLRREIQRQSRVSYALIATVAESWVEHSNMQPVILGPLQDQDLSLWLIDAMARSGLKFAPGTQALELFLSYVQGHMGNAISLARRLWSTYWTTEAGDEALSLVKPTRINLSTPTPALIYPHHVYRSALALVEDLALTFESLILLLPPSQVRVLESLALDPTASPHSREYIQKHQLSRGGGLQGALASLEQKGLVYGSEYGYQITMPLLSFWLKHRLT